MRTSRPCTFSSVLPWVSLNTNNGFSWISPFLQPRTSVISMVRLDLSRSLERWMMISSAEEICWRIAGSGRPAFPCSTMVSRRLSISLVELAWPVERLPSWPVFIAFIWTPYVPIMQKYNICT